MLYEELENRLTRDGVSCHPLETSHAFHSVLMEDAVAPFVSFMGRLGLKPPSVPFVSNVTGDWITAEQATDPVYWGRHLRQPVRFAAGLEKLFEDPAAVLVEVGPGRALSGLASQHPAKSPEHKIVASLRSRQDTSPDDRFLLSALGELWTSGVAVDWAAFHGDERRLRVSLPTYPFRAEAFLDGRAETPAHGPPGVQRRFTTGRFQLAFYRPAWKKSDLQPMPAIKNERSGSVVDLL